MDPRDREGIESRLAAAGVEMELYERWDGDVDVLFRAPDEEAVKSALAGIISEEALRDERQAARDPLEKQVADVTPPTFIWHTVPDDCVPVRNTLLFVDALMEHGVPVEVHLFPSGGHGLSLGTTETAWQGVNGIEECVQVWPELFRRWMLRTFDSCVR